jgi:hypothetical protein
MQVNLAALGVDPDRIPVVTPDQVNMRSPTRTFFSLQPNG